MPSWSPDGREIAFLSDRDGVWGVYTMAAIGGIPRIVLSLPGIENLNWSAPQWSSDGTRMTRLRSSGRRERRDRPFSAIVGHDARGSARPRRKFLLGLEREPGWPSIRVCGRRGGKPGCDSTLDDSELGRGKRSAHRRAHRSSGARPGRRDGRKVFYVSNRGGSMDLWQQAVADDGTPIGEPLAVTQGLGIRSAAFSPDGARLAYARGGRVANVWRVPIPSDRPATWADATQVTSERRLHRVRRRVSRTARLLAVSSDRRGNQDLWLVARRGWRDHPAHDGPDARLEPALVAGRTRDCVLRVSQWQPGHLGHAFAGWSGATAHLTPGSGLVPGLVARWPRDRVPVTATSGHLDRCAQTEASRVRLRRGVGAHRRMVTRRTLASSLEGQNRLYRVAREGGEPSLLSSATQQAYGASLLS